MRWLLVASLLLCSAAHAEECEVIESRTNSMSRTVIFSICDGDHSAAPCGECDIPVLIAGEMPDVLTFTLERTFGCASVVNVRGLAAVAGQPFTVGALSIAGQTSVTVAEPRWVSFDATLDTPAGCTDVEVIGTASFRLGGLLP